MTKIAATFRLRERVHKLLDALAGDPKPSKTEIVEQSVLFAGGLLMDASARTHNDLCELRDRHGADARIVIAVTDEDGVPTGRVIINGAAPEDVRAVPYVDLAAGVAQVFLQVASEGAESPSLARIGKEWVLVREPRVPVGELPWPPKPNLGIVIELAELDRVVAEAETPLDLDLAPGSPILN